MSDDEFKPVYRELGGEMIPVSYGRDLSPLIKAGAWEDAFEDEEDMLTIVRKRLERDSGRRHSFEDALAVLGITREELDEEDGDE